ncbi:serine-rich adhesin for platelets-like [Scomber scombrus]|uniref:Serine-rich adhesin for platelets-like n=1 Tax=Scomber scombrus TaxID=13677 RepID=A0AAV1QL17_SCOSC
MKNKVKTPSNTFNSGVKEQYMTTGYKVVQKLNSEEPKPRSDPIKGGHFQGSISHRVSHFSSPLSEKGNTVTSQKTEQINVAPAIKTSNNPTINRRDSFSNKGRKSVRFAPDVDVAPYDKTSQLTPKTKLEELGKKFSDQTELNQVDESKEFKDEKNDIDHLSSEISKEQHTSKVNLEPLEHKCHGETAITLNTENSVNTESSQEIPQTGDEDSFTDLKGVVEKVEESLDTQSFTEMKNENSTQEVVTHQELSKKLDVIPINSENERIKTVLQNK